MKSEGNANITMLLKKLITLIVLLIISFSFLNLDVFPKEDVVVLPEECKKLDHVDLFVSEFLFNSILENSSKPECLKTLKELMQSDPLKSMAWICWLANKLSLLDNEELKVQLKSIPLLAQKIEYTHHGEITSVLTYYLEKNGIRVAHGPTLLYLKKDMMMFAGEYRHGYRNGTWMITNLSTGELLAKGQFVEGKLLNGSFWLRHPDGAYGFVELKDGKLAKDGSDFQQIESKLTY
jgi:hypothetical protein